MRPITLTLDGINSFAEAQTVDFTKAGADNLFVIAGETGSGKTTILDGILLCLYKDSGSRTRLEDYINLRREEAAVSFTFMLDGRRYCAARILSRKQNRNKMTLTDADTNAVLAEGMDAFKRLETLIGLDRRDFTQVVVLQQGEFAAFLKQTKADRNAVVGKLFRLGRFSGLRDRCKAAKYDAAKDVELTEVQLKPLEPITKDSIRLKKERHTAAAEAAAKAETDGQAAEKALTELRAAAQRYAEQQQLLQEIEQKKQALMRETAALQLAERRVQAVQARAVEIKAMSTRRETLTKKRVAAEDAVAAQKERDEKDAERNRLIALYRGQESEYKQTEEAHQDARKRLTAIQEDVKKASAGLTEFDPFAADAESAMHMRRADAAARVRACRESAAKAAECKQELDKRIQTLAEKERAAEVMLAAKSEKAKAGAAARAAEADAAAARDKAALENAAERVASLLQAGDTCPVCGGTVQTLTHKPISDAAANAYLAAAAARERAETDERVAEAAAAVALSECRSAETAKREAEEAYQKAQAAVSAVQPDKLQHEVQQYDAVCALLISLRKSQDAVKELAHAAQLKSLAMTETKERGTRIAKELEAAATRLQEKLGEGATDAKKLLSELDAELQAIVAAETEYEREVQAAAGEVSRLTAAAAGYKGSIESLSAKVSGAAAVDPNAVAEAQQRADAAAAARQAAAHLLGELTAEVKADAEAFLRKTELQKELVTLTKRAELVERLHKLLTGGAFTEFVSAAYIKDFCLAASERMRGLSGGKYSLEYEEDSGEFFVRDFLSGNERRSIKTLSGGEMFLASLSMAAAISAEIARNMHFECFFIDEGFGTLDETAIETVTAALSTLSKDTMVGLITHRNELKERIPGVINVRKADESRGSRIE